MKIILFLCALAAANATQLRFGFPGLGRGLNDDLAQLIDFLPVDEVRAIARDFIDGDEEFQSVVSYLQGPDWAALVAAVAGNPSWGNFKAYCLENGVDVDEIVGNIHDLIGGIDVPSSGGDMGGVRAFVDRVLGMLDRDAFTALIDEMLTESASFRDFFEFISSDASRQFLNEVLELDEVQRVIAVLEGYGIDVDYIIQLVRDFLGWTRFVAPGVPLEYL